MTYIYDGPILLFGNCVSSRWHAETEAKNKIEAIRNFTYRAKVLLNRNPNTKVDILPEKVRLKGGEQ